MRDYYNIRVNLPGGITSPGFLRDVLTAALKAKVTKVSFGARQQLLMTVHYEEMKSLQKELQQQEVCFEVNADRFPNIISSYCGEGVFKTGQWLTENEYHTVLDSFEFQPSLKVNISDSNQSFTPFFTGNLNFVSSPEPHFWYLYIRPQQSNHLYKWPVLVYTNQIGMLAREIESHLSNSSDLHENKLFETVKEKFGFISLPIERELELPSFSLPYYEGFNRYEPRTWLGLYRRDEQFSVEFLIDVCSLCLKRRIGEICATPWKSLIIKGIQDQHRTQWSYVLGKHNINVRHAANELAWQTEDHTEEGRILKNKLIRYIEKNDTRTFGLCFGIQTRPKSEVFGSILIRKRPVLTVWGLILYSVYDLYYTENFNPNSRTYLVFEKGLFLMQLGGQVERLCKKFSNGRLLDHSEKQRPERDEEIQAPVHSDALYQCPDCMSIYDERYGDNQQGIAAGTPFDLLPESYACSVCDTEKQKMKQIFLTEMNPV